MYVMRDENGMIVCVFAAEQSYATEFVALDDPEMIEFYERTANPHGASETNES